MEGHFRSQVQMPYYHGYARQRGHGIGSVALTMGRVALPLLKNYVLPAAKRIGRDLIEAAIPEVIDVIAGKTTAKSALKRTARKTATKQLGGGQKRKGVTKRKPVSRSKKINQRSRADILKGVRE